MVDLLTGECETVMAGAEPPAIIWTAGAIEPLRLEGLPLACDDTEYEILRTRLKPGDLLMMTTEGLAKSRQGKHSWASTVSPPSPARAATPERCKTSAKASSGPPRSMPAAP